MLNGHAREIRITKTNTDFSKAHLLHNAINYMFIVSAKKLCHTIEPQNLDVGFRPFA